MAHANPSALPRPIRSLDSRSIPIIRSRLAPERRRILRPKNPTQRRAAVLVRSCALHLKRLSAHSALPQSDPLLRSRVSHRGLPRFHSSTFNNNQACYSLRCAPCVRQALSSAQRTDKVSTHKGQVAFPGGMVDATDRDLVHTALRETHEEIVRAALSARL